MRFGSKSIDFAKVFEEKRDFDLCGCSPAHFEKKKLLWLQRGGGGTTGLQPQQLVFSQNAQDCSHRQKKRGRGGRDRAAHPDQPLFR